MSVPTEQANENNENDKNSDKKKIHALINAWGEASAAGDLTAQLNLMTHDVIFLTPDNPPMHRDQFAVGFKAMIAEVSLACRSNIQEITINGDLAVCWNLLEVDFTPIQGGETVKHAGHTLTALRRGTDGQWRIWRDANLLALI
jgi:uncharacterized protein (TIGR02246 family)